MERDPDVTYLTDSYHAREKTIRAAGENVPQNAKQTRSRRVAKTAVNSQVTKEQVNPLLWDWLKESGPKTESGRLDRSRIQFQTDYHVTPDSETIDSAVIYDTPEQKLAANPDLQIGTSYKHTN